MKLQLAKASTDVTVNVFIQDSSSATGAGLTGLVFNTASLVCYYARHREAAVQLALATMTVTGAHDDGGFVEIDSTNMPGVYRLDLSDAICATGDPHVLVMLKGAADMAPLPLEIQLVDFDLNSAANVIGSVSGAVGSVTGAVGSVTGNVGGNVTGSTASVVGAVGSVAGNVDGNVTGSVGSVVGAVGSVTGAVGSVTGSVGSVAGNVDGSTASVVGAVGSVAGNVDGSVASVVGAVGSVAGNVDGSVGSVVGAVGSVTGAVGSVTGAVGSVSGNVDGNVTGSVGSLAAQAKLDVNAECDTALTDYDPPTKGEMDTGFAALNDVSTAEVNTEVDTALSDIGLDHLLGAAVAGADVTDDSIIAQMVSKSGTADWDSFVNTTDSLEAIRDNQAGADASAIADAVWDEAKAGHTAGGSFGEEVQAHALSSEIAALNDVSAADVNAQCDTALTDYDGPTHAEMTAELGALNDLSAAQVNAEVDTALSDYDGPTKAEMDSAHALLSTAAALTVHDGKLDTVDANVDTLITNVPDVISLAAINAECDTALTDYDPPTKAEMDVGHGLLATEAKQDIIDGIVDAILVDTGTTIPALIAALNDPTKEAIADEILNRNLAGGGSGNTRNVRNALRLLRNKSGIVAGTLTVTEEDDATPAWTAAVSTAAGNPISEIDPV